MKAGRKDTIYTNPTPSASEVALAEIRGKGLDAAVRLWLAQGETFHRLVIGHMESIALANTIDPNGSKRVAFGFRILQRVAEAL